MKAIRKSISYILMIILCIFVFFPLLWILISSFKELNEIYAPEIVWFPKEIKWQNYIDVIKETFLVQSFLNSLKIVIPPVAIGTLTSAMAGFAFAKLDFPGKNLLFTLMFGTIAIPGIVTMIPSYLLFDSYGWLDTILPLIIPGMCGGVMTTFFLRQYISGLPTELKDAAIIDGLSYGGVFFKIYLPLAKPAVITQLILAFHGSYNDYMGPLLYINDESMQTIQIVLNSFIAEYAANWQFMLAGSVLALIPTIIIFLFCQRYLVEGIAHTGIKG